jgi:hypothetical protein
MPNGSSSPYLDRSFATATASASTFVTRSDQPSDSLTGLGGARSQGHSPANRLCVAALTRRLPGSAQFASKSAVHTTGPYTLQGKSRALWQ